MELWWNIVACQSVSATESQCVLLYRSWLSCLRCTVYTDTLSFIQKCETFVKHIIICWWKTFRQCEKLVMGTFAKMFTPQEVGLNTFTFCLPTFLLGFLISIFLRIPWFRWRCTVVWQKAWNLWRSFSRSNSTKGRSSPHRLDTPLRKGSISNFDRTFCHDFNGFGQFWRKF